MAVSQCFRAVRKTETIVDVNRLNGSILRLRLYIERKRLKRAQVPIKSMFPLSDATMYSGRDLHFTAFYVYPPSTRNDFFKCTLELFKSSNKWILLAVI